MKDMNDFAKVNVIYEEVRYEAYAGFCSIQTGALCRRSGTTSSRRQDRDRGHRGRVRLTRKLCTTLASASERRDYADS